MAPQYPLLSRHKVDPIVELVRRCYIFGVETINSLGDVFRIEAVSQEENHQAEDGQPDRAHTGLLVISIRCVAVGYRRFTALCTDVVAAYVRPLRPAIDCRKVYAPGKPPGDVGGTTSGISTSGCSQAWRDRTGASSNCVAPGPARLRSHGCRCPGFARVAKHRTGHSTPTCVLRHI